MLELEKYGPALRALEDFIWDRNAEEPPDRLYLSLRQLTNGQLIASVAVDAVHWLTHKNQS
jgi:hypothetical protein